MIDNVYTTPVAYDMNTKKHGIGHTQHQEQDFKFVYVRFSHTQPQLCNFVRRSGGTVVEEKILVLNVSQSELNPRTRTCYLIGRQ